MYHIEKNERYVHISKRQFQKQNSHNGEIDEQTNAYSASHTHALTHAPNAPKFPNKKKVAAEVATKNR